jgi:hypothetical protein
VADNSGLQTFLIFDKSNYSSSLLSLRDTRILNFSDPRSHFSISGSFALEGQSGQE